MTYPIHTSHRTLADLDPFETRDLWTKCKDDPCVSDFIPVDLRVEVSVEKTKVFLLKTYALIQNLPRSPSMNCRIVSFTIKAFNLHHEPTPLNAADDSASCERMKQLACRYIKGLNVFQIAKLRKKEDFATILNRLLNPANPNEIDLEDSFYLEENKETLSSITILDLSISYISTFPSTLCPYIQNVTAINLGKNNLESTSLRFLIDLFQLPLLESLDLSFNSFSASDWACINSLLPLIKNLKFINLRGANLQEAPKPFFETLFKFPLLESIDFSYNLFSKKAWAFMQTLLPHTQKVHSVRLKAANLAEAPDSFLDSLLSLPHLRNLDLSSNDFSKETLVKIHREAKLKKIFITT